ncbi:hypothetical protein Syn7803US40_98 [Synechococcus phage ACG-2014f]|uniref:HNH endonuclease n=1 Tax=Synechococcus phage ACG-2014f TaxID=1493511 RepID=A0A0E3HJ60_9CAUD|nr:hypothetical protein Syn7803US40_98 [Synechococcus phage ACG-2014f]
MDRDKRNGWARNRYHNDPVYREKVKRHNRESAKRNRQQRTEYSKITRRQQRLRMIEHLGGKCVGCGTTEQLQFDHIDRKDKKYSITKRLGVSDETLLPEVNKCQLLCKQCHEIKSTIDHDRKKLMDGMMVEDVTYSNDRIIVTLVRR